MTKRILYFGNPAKLRIKDLQLMIESIDKPAVSIPVEDISIVVLDHQQITLSVSVMQAFTYNQVVLITCDKRHMPDGLLSCLNGNCIQQERHELQLSATVPNKKQLWAQTVKQKIKNQSGVLRMCFLDIGNLDSISNNVKSGDSGNCEAVAAAYYWKTIFNHIPGFKRSSEGELSNSLLNYGYAILRAVIARAIVCGGLIPTLGLFHRNRYNAFCLADDLMEPYRPYVDIIVRDILQTRDQSSELTKEDKTALLNIPNTVVVLEDERTFLSLAAQRTVLSLVKYFEGNQRKLIYPEINVDNRNVRLAL